MDNTEIVLSSFHSHNPSFQTRNSYRDDFVRFCNLLQRVNVFFWFGIGDRVQLSLVRGKSSSHKGILVLQFGKTLVSFVQFGLERLEFCSFDGNILEKFLQRLSRGRIQLLRFGLHATETPTFDRFEDLRKENDCAACAACCLR
jgi:hypothetical protein